MKYYFGAFKNYAKFDGRATRKEYWWFILFHYIVLFALAFLDDVLGFYSTDIPLRYGYMTLVYMFASACPYIGLQVRRLHDVGKSGYWWWAKWTPILSLYILYLNLKPSEPTINAYGYPSDSTPNGLNRTNVQESQQDDCFTVCVYDYTDKKIRKIKKVIDINKFPPTKYASNGTYYAIDKINNDKKIRTYYTKEKWKAQVEIPLTDIDCKVKYCSKCGYELVNDSNFCSQCGAKIVESTNA